MSQLPLPRRLIGKRSSVIELLEAYQDESFANPTASPSNQNTAFCNHLASHRSKDSAHSFVIKSNQLVLPRLSVIRIAASRGCPLPVGFYCNDNIPTCFAQPVVMADLRAKDYRRPSQAHL